MFAKNILLLLLLTITTILISVKARHLYLPESSKFSITDVEPDDTIFQLVKRNVPNCDPEGQIPGSVCGKSIPWSPKE